MEKVIIDQESLNRFIDKVYPGAYISLTRIDFRALDNANIKPIGVYGSRERIVDLLLEVGAIEPRLFVIFSLSQCGRGILPTSHSVNALLTGGGNSVVPHLRSGIYFVQPPSLLHTDPQVFVIYWPEEATWDDDAVSSVKRNRVTFMRYDTKT